MTNTFTASNGITLRRRSNGNLLLGDQFEYEENGTALALAEFFRHEEDARIGRWRSKADPAWTAIVQDGSRYIYFRHEDGEHGFSIAPDGRNIVSWSPSLQSIAREYFDAQTKPNVLVQAQDTTDAWVTLAEYTPDLKWRAEQTAHLLQSQDVPARVIEGEAAA